MSKPRKDRIDVVPFGDGFLVVVGAVALVLDREAAEELTVVLVDAVEPGDLLDRPRVQSN